MEYLDCPNCRARLHVGLLYVTPEACPRCGAPTKAPRRNLRARLGAVTPRHSRSTVEPTDWEQITRAQYDHRTQVSKAPEPEPHGESDNRAA
jgi:hypothetical protein